MKTLNLAKNRIKTQAFLILFSLLSFVIWRAELECHGWKGLIWLGYFHWAIPISLSLFLIWVNWRFNLGYHGLRIKANLMLIFWMGMGYYLLTTVLFFHFAAGPIGMLNYFENRVYHSILSFLVLPLFPIYALLSLRLIRVSIPLKQILISFLLFCFSFEIASLFLKMVNHVGGANYVHAVKSGFVFPILFFSLGFPLIFAEFRRSNSG